jgi:mannosyltransferase OCH1-like enzyme
MEIIFIFIILLILVLIYYFKYNKKEKFTLNQNIPKVIYLTYKTKDIPPSVIDKFKKVYPNYEIKIYDNNDCIEFLNKEFGQEYVDIFNFIKDGPIKADFWRVCILYKYGGIYSDIDIVPNINIEEILESDTTFLTCISHDYFTLNPHFIVCIPNHIVLKLCIDKYLEFYRNKKKYNYWDWSIVFIIKNIIKNKIDVTIFTKNIYLDKDNNKYQFLNEKVKFNILDFNLIHLLYKIFISETDRKCVYNNKVILYNKNNNYKEHQFI